MSWSKRSSLLVSPFVIACIGTPLLAQAAPVVKFWAELGFVCEWEPRPPITKRVVVDLSLGASNHGRMPNAEDVRAVEAAGGRVLCEFRVALLRAELVTGAVCARVRGPASMT